MRDRNGHILKVGERVFISIAAREKFNLPSWGIVSDNKPNKEQLISVETSKGTFDLHAKSIWLEYIPS